MRYLPKEEAKLRQMGQKVEQPAVEKQELSLKREEVEFEVANELIRPEAPRTLEETGLSVRLVEGLILKTLRQKGQLTMQQIAGELHVTLGVIEHLVRELRDRKVIDTFKPLHYELTTAGRQLCDEYEKVDAYVGPCPVSFEDYCQMVLKQAEKERRVTLEEVKEVFEGYPMRPELLYTLKEGFNSQRCMLFYGPPGNGKTLIVTRLHSLLKEPVCLPYAFEFNGRVVRYYDPSYHQTWDELIEKEEREATPPEKPDPYKRLVYLKPDRRWLICKAPLVVVGTEFRVEHLEINFSGVYDAPPHVKANNGFFIFDDLGRQTQDHNMILNQFIFPLESQEAIVRMTGGSTLRVPYRQRLFLSTNLNKEDIIDDAFKRRLLYQVLVDRPTVDLWKQIFLNEARKFGLTDEEEIEHYANLLVEWYERDGRVIRACDPRNIFIMIDASLEEGEDINEILDDVLFERIYWQYPAGLKRDEVVYEDESNLPRIRKLVEWELKGLKEPLDLGEAGIGLQEHLKQKHPRVAR
ncbi:MAG TPA: hypothetical protein EYP85_05310 [Armatimonadetes bacterium]|nr:hypothetical protein [Armatimonadota bacterium]